MAFIKSKKRVSKAVFNNLILSSKQEVNIVKNIANNCPRLSGDFSLEKAKLILAKYNINFDCQTYIISVTNNTNLSTVNQELTLLKKLETNGTYLNILLVATCDIDKVYKLKYQIAQLDFTIDIIGIYNRENILPSEYYALNMLNVNYYCGTHFDENIAKFKGYSIKSKEGTLYDKELNSTMHSSQRQRYVLCNYCIERSKTYDYLTDTEITRLDLSCAQGKEIISYFISLEDIKYFHVEVNKFYIKINDFDLKKEYYYFSNKPIFSNAIYNKKGIYFSFVNNSNFIYIFRSNKMKELPSILECERDFLRAQTLLNNLPKVVVKSKNLELDDIVNNRLPQSIIKQMYSQDNLEKTLFRNFATLSYKVAKEQKPKSGFDKTICKYFSLLSTYYGVGFGNDGIYLSYNKDKLIDSKVSFKKGNNNYSVNISNKNLASETFAFNGVEYTGINYLPYNKLSQSLNLQM